MPTTTTKSVRTRFAPSPTGYPHIGSIWIALMQWLYVRHHGGTFVLRIDDTDRQRFVEGAEDRMLEALRWYGISYDEGPDIGGPNSPYRASERLVMYTQHANQLVEGGHAYPCFCTAEELETMRREQQQRGEPPRYDRRCRNLTSDVARARQSSEPHVIRMKFPEDGETEFTDLIRGLVSFKNALIDDQVILKSDGWPTYHLASVVDDHLMNMTTVIRGEEWLSSTPKHLVLFKMFGWEPTQFAHLPLILGPDRSKLSKRHGSTEALKFRDEGYLAEALVNFLALLGWNPKTEQEIFSREELVQRFDFNGVNKSGAIFDVQKLQWFNAHYIRQLSVSDLVERVIPYLVRDGYLDETKADRHYLEQIVSLFQERLKTLAEISDLAAYFFVAPDYEPSLLVWKQSTAETTAARLKRVSQILNDVDDYQENVLERELKQVIESEQLGTGDTLWPLRVALSGRKESPGPFALASVLGKEETLARLKAALAKLTS